jgi:hypothetical protein
MVTRYFICDLRAEAEEIFEDHVCSIEYVQVSIDHVIRRVHCYVRAQAEETAEHQACTCVIKNVFI